MTGLAPMPQIAPSGVGATAEPPNLRLCDMPVIDRILCDDGIPEFYDEFIKAFLAKGGEQILRAQMQVGHAY